MELRYSETDEAFRAGLRSWLDTTLPALARLYEESSEKDRATLAYVYGRAGQPVQARRALVKLEELNRHQQLDPGPFLAAYIGMGDKELAFAWLEKAYSQHSNVLEALKVEPCYDFLRGDPRFQDVMRRVGLAQ